MMLPAKRRDETDDRQGQAIDLTYKSELGYFLPRLLSKDEAHCGLEQGVEHLLEQRLNTENEV